MRISPLAVIVVLISRPFVSGAEGTGTLQNVAAQSVDRAAIATLSGVVYTSCRVTSVEPDGITVFYAKGIVKIPFTDLSEEYRTKYRYNPSNAVAYATKMNQKQAEAWATAQARQQEAAAAAAREMEKAAAARQQAEAAAAAAREQKETDALIEAAEAKMHVLAALAQQARQGRAFASNCRVLLGCTKETVSATLGPPSTTKSSASTWVYDSFIDPKSGRHSSVHVDFGGETVERVYW